ncbi:MAG TPA: hypothetical protein VNE42_11520 [Acidimicrobiales bacterium]|nr:hypothetical protein [Acidimicrobiales bacterium]
MTETADHSHVASNGRAELSLDELANLHGGLAHFMLEISDRATRCYQAGRARNRRVARHQLGELTKTLRLAVLTRPQYDDAIELFITDDLAKVRTVIDSEDWDHFDEVWEGLTIAVNKSHEEFDHGYLVWKVPESAPSDLDLSPRS